MIADIERAHARRNGLHKLGVAVPEIEGAAVEMHVDQAQPGHVPDEVALAPVNDQVDAALAPEVGLAWVPELPGLVEDLGLGLHAVHGVVLHRPACALRNAARTSPATRRTHNRPNHVSG